MDRYSKLNVGDTKTIEHRITQGDVDKFVDLSGDDNKLHVDKDFALRTSFKRPVVHGMVGASFISTVTVIDAAILQEAAELVVLDSLSTWRIGDNDVVASFTSNTVSGKSVTFQIFCNKHPVLVQGGLLRLAGRLDEFNAHKM